MNTFTFLLACFLSVNLLGQTVTLKTQDMTVQPQETFKLHVQAEDFTDVVAAQFALFWDKNVLEFKGVQDFGLPDMVAGEPTFNLFNVSEGKLRFTWEDVLVSGVTIPDMTTMFSVSFKAIGPLYSSSNVVISADTSSTFFPIELGSSNGNVLDVDVINGTVLVGGLNASSETETLDFTLFQNSPNPFTEITYINFDLKNSSLAQLSIYDQTGKVVFEETTMFAAGHHTIPVKREVFQSSGTYFFTLKTERATATRQLIAH